MRSPLIANAALIATSFCSPLSAQDHSSYGSDPQPEMDHCAMGHLPPEQCPPKDEHTDHSTMDHGAMDHSQPGGTTDRSAPVAAPEDAVPARAFDGPRHAADAIWGADAMAFAKT